MQNFLDRRTNLNGLRQSTPNEHTESENDTDSASDMKELSDDEGANEEENHQSLQHCLQPVASLYASVGLDHPNEHRSPFECAAVSSGESSFSGRYF